MADLSNTKDITTVDSTPSVAITDKIYINKGGKLQQVSLATAIESKIDSSLSKSKFAADAKATKDAISKVDSDIKAQNPISETIFSNTVTFSPTAYGNAIPEQIEGYIKQDTTKGLQLFDANKISDYSAGGVTLRNNQDGSFTISGSGELTEVFSTSYSLSHEDSVKLFPAGSYQITRGNIYPAIFLQKRVNNVNTSINNKSVDTNYLDVTEEDVANESYIMQLVFYGTAGSSIVPGTIKPMAWASAEVPQDADWEPYTGGQPSPNPDYPQIVHGAGDMGFFDGEYQYVYHDNDNTLNNNPEWVSSVNIVPCKTGDNVEIVYAKANSKSMYGIIYYKGDKFVSALVAQTGNGKFTVPSGVDGFQWQVYEGGNKPDPSKVIVTINGMYAICVKTVGKNILDFQGFLDSRSSQYTKAGDRYRITGTGSGYEKPIQFSDEDIEVTISGSVTSESGTNYRLDILNLEDQVVAALINATTKVTAKGCKLRLNYGNNGAGIYENIMLELGKGTDNFVPYQGKTAYIPISSPMFDGDYLFKRNMAYKVLRRNGYVVFDGSEDEQWESVGVSNGFGKFSTRMSDGKKFIKNDEVFTSHFFVSMDWTNPTKNSFQITSLSANNGVIGFMFDGATDIVQWKTWLQSNHIAVAYELATPVEEELSPEAQKAIHSIMACDELTTLEIVGVPTDAEVQNQFLLPRNVDGALNTTAYATAKRNEIALE